MPDSMKPYDRVRGLAIMMTAIVFSCGCENDAPRTSESPVELEFHEIGAGSEGDDGWVRAKSSTAGFTVLLPGRYNDFQQSAKTVEGNSLTTHHVGMTSSGGVKYSVTAFEGGDPKPKEEYLAGIVAGFGKTGGAREKKELELDGNPGVQFVVAFSGSGATVRAYAFDDMFYLLIAEYPTALASSETDNVERFLESFGPE